MIKTIIFDYAGVLTPTPDKIVFTKEHHHKFGYTESELMDILYKNWDQAAINQISSDDYWSLLAKDLKTDANKLKDSIIKTFPIDTRMVNLLKILKGNYTLVMMSNQIEDWLESEIDKNNLRNLFDHFLNSYQVKIQKPDTKIFDLALKQTNSKPVETLFIDDSEKNIIAAKNLGIKTIQFRNFEQFYKELESFIKLKDKH